MLHFRAIKSWIGAFGRKVITVILIFVLVLSNVFSIYSAEDTTAKQTTYHIGDTIQLGEYKNEMILWEVVKIDNEGNLLLLSEKVIEFMPFNITGTSDEKGVLWENSSLRSWLNNDFLLQAFYNNEKAMIKENKNLSGISDKVFLLDRAQWFDFLATKGNNYMKPSTEYVNTKRGYYDSPFWLADKEGIYQCRSSGSANSIEYPSGVCPAIFLDVDTIVDADGYEKLSFLKNSSYSVGSMKFDIINSPLLGLDYTIIDFPYTTHSHRTCIYKEELVASSGKFKNFIYLVKYNDTYPSKKLLFDFSTLYSGTPDDNQAHLFENQLYYVNDKYVFCKSFLYHSEEKTSSGLKKSLLLNKYMAIDKDGKQVPGEFKLTLPNMKMNYAILDLTFSNGMYYLTIGELGFTNSGHMSDSPSDAYIYTSGDMVNWKKTELLKRYTDSLVLSTNKGVKARYATGFKNLETTIKKYIPLQYYKIIQIDENSYYSNGKGDTSLFFRNVNEYSTSGFTYLTAECSLSRTIEWHSKNNVDQSVFDFVSIPLLIRVNKDKSFQVISPRNFTDAMTRVYKAMQSRITFKNNTYKYFTKLLNHYSKKVVLSQDELLATKKYIISQNDIVTKLQNEVLFQYDFYMQRNYENMWSFNGATSSKVLNNGVLYIKDTFPENTPLKSTFAQETADNEWQEKTKAVLDNYGYIVNNPYQISYNQNMHLLFNGNTLTRLSLPANVDFLQITSLYNNTLFGTAYVNNKPFQAIMRK